MGDGVGVVGEQRPFGRNDSVQAIGRRLDQMPQCQHAQPDMEGIVAPFYITLGEFLPGLKARGTTVIAVSHDDRYFDIADDMKNLGRYAKMPNGELRYLYGYDHRIGVAS